MSATALLLQLIVILVTARLRLAAAPRRAAGRGRRDGGGADARPGGHGRALSRAARQPAAHGHRRRRRGAGGLPGPQGCISPNGYPSKHDAHRQVLTWNHEVVHAHGRLRFVDDEKFVRGVVARLTRRHETSQARPWKMGDAPREYLAQMLASIVGIEVALTRLEGKRKLSQNREVRDREGAVRALHEQGQHPLAASMARTIAR